MDGRRAYGIEHWSCVVLLLLVGCATDRLHVNAPAVHIDPQDFELTVQQIHNYDVLEPDHLDGQAWQEPVQSWHNYTRIGTAFYTIGTEKRHLHWHDDGTVHANLKHDQYVGRSHDLALPVRLNSETIPRQSLVRPYSPLIRDEFQPAIVGLNARVRGTGILKLELVGKESNRKPRPLRWVRFRLDDSDQFQNLIWLWQAPSNCITEAECSKEPLSVLNTEYVGRVSGSFRSEEGIPHIQLPGRFGNADVLRGNPERVFQVGNFNRLTDSTLFDAIKVLYCEPEAASAGWVLEGQGTEVFVDSFGLVAATPHLRDTAGRTVATSPGTADRQQIDSKRFFLKSLAKFARCYDVTTGLVRDRANFPAGDQDNIPTSGMFCLALAAGSSLGIVDEAMASAVFQRVHEVVSCDIPSVRGWLPHFVKKSDGEYSSSSEYSTVDTAIYYHGMLAAARALQELAGLEDADRKRAAEIEAELCKQIGAIDFNFVTVPQHVARCDGTCAWMNFISMEIARDGRTVAHERGRLWDDWGGEGALIMCLRQIHRRHSGKCDDPDTIDRTSVHFARQSDAEDFEGTYGRIYEGRGFIAELHSLFYPQFNSENRCDDWTKQDWLKVRRDLREAQIARVAECFSGSAAAKAGLFGFSSGEYLYAETGKSYLENGTWRREPGIGGVRENVTPEPVLFPHYILMSSCLPDPRIAADNLTKLRFLEERGLFPMWGLVENMDVHLETSHALIGSLNAAFETLGAYHLYCNLQSTTKVNVIYEAARKSPALNDAIRVFYDSKPLSEPGDTAVGGGTSNKP